MSGPRANPDQVGCTVHTRHATLDPNTGRDSPPLTKTKSDFAFYQMPVTTTWVFQTGRDFPRLDISIAGAGNAYPSASSRRSSI